MVGAGVALRVRCPLDEDLGSELRVVGPRTPVIRLGPGETLESRYEVGECIGRGAVAEVYRGTCRATGATRALKVVRFNSLSEERARRRIYLEAETLRRLRHPNVIAVHEVLMDERMCCLALDLLPYSGETRVMGGRMDEDQAREVVRQLLVAVQYLHASGVAHRDIKPENVVFGESGGAPLVQLIDFGLVKLLPPAGETRWVPCTPCGSASTMAPEMVEAMVEGGGLDARPVAMSPAAVRSCDIFSVGCVAYIFLCQAPPFRGSTCQQLQQSIARGEGSLRHSSRYGQLSPACQSFLKRCLAVDGRPTATEALAHPWLSGGDEAVMTPTSPPAAPEDVRAKLGDFYRLATLQEMEIWLTRPRSMDDFCSVRGARSVDCEHDQMCEDGGSSALPYTPPPGTPTEQTALGMPRAA
eukprot:TRINITY_DN22668_c1_g1_i1.p1 TRINITY_DN22668_c1_g1~~TRINITY_DN22668_c1_g1_i1.p1  ORF type:complete len:414 (+),score=55.41 TRINITY_DN22668_c1_g1_i1:92-1333(+)